MSDKVAVLFVCSMNQWRSPTAEQIFRNRPGMEVRSAGTNKGARCSVNRELLEWADWILVMEYKHLGRLRDQYSEQMKNKDVAVLDIPDLYRYMDPNLIRELKISVEPILERLRPVQLDP